MAGPRIDAGLIDAAISTPRWNVLARTGLDVATIGTWDAALHRRTRLMVPMDVQALVVPASGAELTVAVRGDSTDAAPFAPGVARAAGVHVHWALPDALLRGEPSARDANGQSEELTLPALPDRWVVLRLLRPRGIKRAHVRGWVINARTKQTLPMESFSGIFPDPVPADVLTRLDAGFGGSLSWTASYNASAGRFGFHDPLSDLPLSTTIAPQGLHDDAAAYVVAGWWTDIELDPVGAGEGLLAFGRRLDSLGWSVVDDALKTVMNADRARRDAINKSVGLASPVESVQIEYAPGVGATISKKVFGPVADVAVPIKGASQIVLATPAPTFATMLHGSIFGVPTTGAATLADDRPTRSAVSIALGQDVDDVVAAFGAGVLGSSEADRESAEKLTAAFTSDLLDRIATADGIADLAEREHRDGFDSRPGPALPGAKPDRFIVSDAASANPLNMGRKGRGAAAQGANISSKLQWIGSLDRIASSKGSKKGREAAHRAGRTAASSSQPTGPAAREVTRPAPREFFTQAPIIALRGVKPNLRHHGDLRFEGGESMRCRYAGESVTELTGVAKASDVLPSLGSGAIPEEVLPIARESILLDPFCMPWLTEVLTLGMPREYAKAVTTRYVGEMARLYGTTGTYDGTSHLGEARSSAPRSAWSDVSVRQRRMDQEISAELAAFALTKGTQPSPVAITTWRQPWVPMWVEWRVQLDGDSSLAGWALGDLDYERAGAAAPPTVSRTISGRNTINTGVAEAMHAGITRWLEAEVLRDAAGTGVLAAGDQSALDRLGDFLEPLDIASASLDGIREQMLGIDYVGQLPLDTPAAGQQPKAIAAALPIAFFGGTLRLDAMRVVDTFGRTLDLDVSRFSTTRSLEVAGKSSSITLRPRALHVARWVMRFVGAPDEGATDPSLRPDAFIDQVTPAAMVNPVAGFLLPDHMDESLEVFATDGTPIGELSHDAISGAVMWEAAPGRPVAPDAGPFTGLSTSQAPIADVAAGVLLADVAARSGTTPPVTSSLSAMLRAIDTTLWTVDTYAALGSPSVAGLVGRPVAVVRATVRLDMPDDTGEVTAGHVGGADARRAIFAAVRDMHLPFRLGALERSDDALLGFYLGDDFAHLHVVDKVVLGLAPASGRLQGALGQLGATIDTTPVPIAHPYVVAEDELWVRPGQEIALTLLMLPAGKLHLTSGLLPRKSMSLAEDWVGPGMKALSPSVRVGPVLVDPSEIRLPLIRALGPRQRFTRRTGPLTWRDDPIKAATMSAYLPRMPHEAQEGWVRVAPDEPDAEAGGAS